MEETTIPTDDLLDAIKLLRSAMEPDRPYDLMNYITSASNVLTGPLTTDQRNHIEQFLRDKEYLPKKQVILYKSWWSTRLEWAGEEPCQAQLIGSYSFYGFL